MQGARGTPESFAASWNTVIEGAREAGRDPSTLHSSKLMYVNPGQDEQAASEQLESYLSFYYGPNYPMEHTGFGDPAGIAAKVSAFGDAGCELMILGLPGPDLAQLEALASQVVPLVR